ncbi:hypothetical protein WJM97_22290 [Okeanomitos corallinicola TIOX110]|uniref:Uncharacterized protein n=1 Tax=Okeanomitos corallinicola TIOX110 TaxID=3133117 RepID=A0ABZ2UWX4_9CYAN
MNTLFNLDQFHQPETKYVNDPYWDKLDEIVLDREGMIDQNGQATLFYDDSQEPPDPDDFENRLDFVAAWREWEKLNPDVEYQFMPVLENSLHLPEQPKKQWIEEYYVTRSGNKYWYYRYCYYDRKIYHVHIPGGCIENEIAQSRKQMIERAIAQNMTPFQIQNFIKGGFGKDGNKLLRSLAPITSSDH